MHFRVNFIEKMGEIKAWMGLTECKELSEQGVRMGPQPSLRV